MQEKTQKNQEFLAHVIEETSKERKERLENRKNELLALKKLRNLDKVKEKAQLSEKFQENVNKKN